ncbi:Homeobox protein OTX2-B [Aphelenchoides besseyi]|nr:Homeobox protein OTX2-B [Aphelenchoides besseyi]
MVNGNPLAFGLLSGYGNMHPPITYKTPPPGKRERTKFSPNQLSYLESEFEKCKYPQGPQRERIATQLNLTDTKVQVWFKNRRAKVRQKQKFEEEINRASSSYKSDSMPSLGVSRKSTIKRDTPSDDHERPPSSPPPALAQNSNHPTNLLAPPTPVDMMPQLPPAMPYFPLPTNMADLTGIKLEPLPQDTSTLLAADPMAMTNVIGNTAFSATNAVPPTNWVNPYMFGNYSNGGFGFSSPYAYNPSSSISSSYDPNNYASFTPNYCMNPQKFP